MSHAEALLQLDAQFLHEPHAHLARLGVDSPVHRATFPDGSPGWFVTGHAEARALLADPRLRKLVNKAFTPRTVAALKPRIQQIMNELLDAIPVPGQVDLLTAFASPLPMTVICELLGVPVEDRAEFRMWSVSVTSSFTAETEKHAADLLDYLTGLVAQRRAHPTQDPLSSLVHVSDGGDQLTDVELTSMACLLLVAGHETTVKLIGTGMRALLERPGQYEELRRDATLVPSAVDEFLRVSSPVHTATVRHVAEPVVVGRDRDPGGRLREGVAAGREQRRPALPRPASARRRPRRERAPGVRARCPPLPRCAARPSRGRDRLPRTA